MENLKLRNWHKHHHLEIDFTSKNIIFGPDLVGKTSVLRAIFLFVNSKETTTKNLQQFITTKQTYATVEGVFNLNNKKTKIKTLIQNKHLSFFLQNQKTPPKLLPIFYIGFFSSDTNLVSDPEKRKQFLSTITQQTFPFLEQNFSQLLDDIAWWNEQSKQNNPKKNVYFLDLLQKKETLIAKNFYEITKQQLELITLLNKKIMHLAKDFFNSEKELFALKLEANLFKQNKIDKNNFIVKTKEFLLQLRDKQTIPQLTLDCFSNHFSFVFGNSSHNHSYKQELFLTLFLQMCFGHFLQTDLKKKVLFLVDDIHIFDSDRQKKILNFLSVFSQYIISTNQQIWDNRPVHKNTSLHRIS